MLGLFWLVDYVIARLEHESTTHEIEGNNRRIDFRPLAESPFPCMVLFSYILFF